MPVELKHWLERSINFGKYRSVSIRPEASTRLFWRLQSNDHSVIAMFSPPDTERNQSFVNLSRLFIRHDVPVPKILNLDSNRGFLLVEDLGDRELHETYGTPDEEKTILAALNVLLKLQRIPKHPFVDKYTTGRLNDELGIFNEYIGERVLASKPPDIDGLAQFLIKDIDSHPKVTLHRDYHSRNLLLDRQCELGVVDFQDALFGSCAYDLSSFLYDCYYEFRQEDIDKHALHFYRMVSDGEIPTFGTENELLRALKICAVQRHLKAAGIFCRLFFLQNKSTHLPYVAPLLVRTRRLCRSIRETHALGTWLQREAIPQLSEKLVALPSK